MPIRNRLTRILGIEHPILLAPMDLVAGGKLAAAVSHAGGLGLLGGGYGNHGWIERDDPFKLGRIGPYDGWRFPSFFSEKTNVDASQISSLACAPSIVSVANLDESVNRIHISSSQGPTRDGRFKPDVAAPGTSVVAAKGFVDGPELWIAMTGTSMSSPFVAGVAAAMLRAAPSLTAAQIGGIMQRTARPLPGKSYDWVNDAGFGVIDPPACLKEAAALSRRLDVTNTFKNSGF